MKAIMPIPGIALLALAALFALRAVRLRRQFGLIHLTETSAIADLKFQAETEGWRSGSKLIEVKGTVACDRPLVALLSETACVYYDHLVEWEFEEVFYADEQRQQVSHTRIDTEVLARQQERIPFWVEDHTGRVLVDPAGAEIIAGQTVFEVDSDAGLPDSVIARGAFSMEAPWLTSLEERQPREYRFQEHAIPVGASVYVLAEAAWRDGELYLQKPAAGGRFVISVKPEEELLAGARRGLLLAQVAAWLCGLLGLAAIGYSLI
ncbi:MAG: E3 ubiquitin ligase family protein [candidate division KSB1 bacterium]|nr:E3 ubiquitin ligase family protein [candidate division KSB1 bacterium]MDZ7273709.1 E3 ubiquitin ligase family protein [candidate division KSB1 bacterium]MDZ7285865.1 E3 ubiquitin ligase family protein [candidate division KSB1 bacterium]MDZ7298897.1 E3 ubiquitin ligase family protein [candidate division KSB1 bacterium]MDZ7309453.1 E3 ubiquitin ligase family protein [candidate division KSB1 bacterium]